MTLIDIALPAAARVVMTTAMTFAVEIDAQDLNRPYWLVPMRWSPPLQSSWDGMRLMLPLSPHRQCRHQGTHGWADLHCALPSKLMIVDALWVQH